RTPLWWKAIRAMTRPSPPPSAAGPTLSSNQANAQRSRTLSGRHENGRGTPQRDGQTQLPSRPPCDARVRLTTLVARMIKHACGLEAVQPDTATDAHVLKMPRFRAAQTAGAPRYARDAPALGKDASAEDQPLGFRGCRRVAGLHVGPVHDIPERFGEVDLD